MGTILPTTSQMTLSFEPGMASRHLSLRDCVAAQVYHRGHGRVASLLDMAPSKLTEKLAGVDSSGKPRGMSLDEFERYVEKTGDLTPSSTCWTASRGIRRPRSRTRWRSSPIWPSTCPHCWRPPVCPPQRRGSAADMAGQGAGAASNRGAITPTDRFAQCRDLCKALALRPQPLSPDEEAAFRSAVARQAALDEARRNPPRERDLLDVAA